MLHGVDYQFSVAGTAVVWAIKREYETPLVIANGKE